MAFYPSQELCAHEAWVTLPFDTHNEVEVLTKVRSPNRDRMYDQLIDCIHTATNPRIRSVGIHTAAKIADEGPWEITTDDPNTLLLYKLWYDSETLRMGMKPQVIVKSQVKPDDMPNHWVHESTQWHFDEDQVMYNDTGISVMNPDARPIESWDNGNPDDFLRKSNRSHSQGVQCLSYNAMGQTSMNSLNAKAVWEALFQ